MIRALALTILLTAAPAVALAAAPAWTVDKAASSIRFSSSFSGQPFSGAFSRWTAQIRFDPAQLAASSVTATIDVGSAATGDKDRDQAMPSADFFAAAKFPRATYTASTFKNLGGGRYQALGQLTIRGISKPLTLPFTLVITGPNARMKASLAINRLAFGVGQNEWKSVEAIPAAVNVTIDLTAHRAP
jgi:polyisoprenoid-binding protein YceI